MTREEFIKYYMDSSKLSQEYRTWYGFKVNDRSKIALPCNCGDDICYGWVMIEPKLVSIHLYQNTDYYKNVENFNFPYHDSEEEGLRVAIEFLKTVGVEVPQ